LKELLTVAGFNPHRVQFTWVSASEGVRFADVVKDVTEKVAAACHEAGCHGDGSPDTNNIKQKVIKHGDRCQENRPLDTLDTKKLLEDGTVNTIIGFQAGCETGLSIPYIINSPEETNKLVWNNRCVPMLSDYLRGRQGKTAIIAKPCDARAVVNLIIENQLKRDDVYIIGMTCDGMVDGDGKMLPACAECTVHTPPVYDTLVGTEPQEITTQSQGVSREPSPWSRFQREMEKCILCYSCRQSCYGCYCKTCFMERGEPDWQTTSPDIGAKMLYHLGRAMHLSGRCVECGACENACASGVNIRYLIKEVTDFIEKTYDYKTGMDLETEPVMLTYKTDDPEIGFQCFGSSDDLNDSGGESNV